MRDRYSASLDDPTLDLESEAKAPLLQHIYDKSPTDPATIHCPTHDSLKTDPTTILERETKRGGTGIGDQNDPTSEKKDD